jgi:hypothetical protein
MKLNELSELMKVIIDRLQVAPAPDLQTSFNNFVEEVSSLTNLSGDSYAFTPFFVHSASKANGNFIQTQS